MTQHWRMFLARSTPPGAILDFSATEFTLEVAVNLRHCLNFVQPTPECLDLVELVLVRAAKYGEAREGEMSELFADTEHALAQSTRLLEIELEYCSRQGVSQTHDKAA